MKRYCLLLTCSLFFYVHVWTSAAPPTSHSHLHAPIGLMGSHGHKSSEMMFSYRFMAMDMRGLQSGTTAIETSTVLRDFMMVPTRMVMQMHMLGGMFAPHEKITLMVMTSYQQRQMEMEGAHQHGHGSHAHPVGLHEMSSTGIGDAKLEGLLTFRKGHHLTLLGNAGVSFPTGSITQTATDGTLLPYPMQIGSGSFEVHPGVTLLGFHGNYSYGSQLRGAFPLYSNANTYRHGNKLLGTVWGALRISDWISIGGRFVFSHERAIIGIYPDFAPGRSPSHRPNFRGGTTVALAFSSDLMVPQGSLTGQRIAVEWIQPVYQKLRGIQLKETSRLILGWQYGFDL